MGKGSLISKPPLIVDVRRRHEAPVAAAKANGVSPGDLIMIHGLPNGAGFLGRLHLLVDWTQGCIAVTNAEIEEIWRVAPDGTPIDIEP
jgi:murein L,D-transpeptidase YafK